MSARFVTCIVAVMALGLAGGCAAQKGQKVVGYNAGKSDNFVKARDAGRYALRGTDGRNVTYYVDKGERIGFRKARSGTVEAYAGDNAPVELNRADARQAYWKLAEKNAH